MVAPLCALTHLAHTNELMNDPRVLARDKIAWR